MDCEVCTHQLEPVLDRAVGVGPTENNTFDAGISLALRWRMAQQAGAWLLATIALGACGVGGASPDGADRNAQLGIVCNASFKTQGTFAIGSPQPAGVQGCWPIGVWTFTATMNTNECPTAPALQAQYQFKAEEIPDNNGDPVQTFTYLTEPAAHYRLKVSSGGGGLCEGGLQIYSPDGLQFWNMKPSLNADGSLTGFGEYSLYKTDQWN